MLYNMNPASYSHSSERELIIEYLVLLHKTKIRKANWIGHILRRNCLLKHVIGGNIDGELDVTRRRGRRRMQLLNDLKEKRGYWILKEEALALPL
jgi:hypothetical protein